MKKTLLLLCFSACISLRLNAQFEFVVNTPNVELNSEPTNLAITKIEFSDKRVEVFYRYKFKRGSRDSRDEICLRSPGKKKSLRIFDKDGNKIADLVDTKNVSNDCVWSGTKGNRGETLDFSAVFTPITMLKTNKIDIVEGDKEGRVNMYGVDVTGIRRQLMSSDVSTPTVVLNPKPSASVTPSDPSNPLEKTTWKPVVLFDNQLFPSFIIGMATFTGAKDFKDFEDISSALGFSIKSEVANAQLTFEIECVEKKYFDKISGQIKTPRQGETLTITPNIPWNIESLRNQIQQTPLKIYFRLFDKVGKKSEQLITVQLRSVEDCIFKYDDLDLKFLFAAYVNEEHEQIDKILNDAVNTGMVSSFSGPDTSFAKSLIQVAAIWRVLQEKGFKYINLTETSGDQGDVLSQKVRPFGKAWKYANANCIDGVVILSSIIKAAGFQPVMVLVPGHAFLGYYTDPDNTNMIYLETTLLGDKSFLEGASTEEERTQAYINSFLAASKTGKLLYDQNMARNPSKVIKIDVTTARKRVKSLGL